MSVIQNLEVLFGQFARSIALVFVASIGVRSQLGSHARGELLPMLTVNLVKMRDNVTDGMSEFIIVRSSFVNVLDCQSKLKVNMR